MQVAMYCKQDFFYGGHEGTEANRIILWKDGMNWIKDNDMLATKATFLQNMMTVDGKGANGRLHLAHGWACRIRRMGLLLAEMREMAFPTPKVCRYIPIISLLPKYHITLRLQNPIVI